MYITTDMLRKLDFNFQAPCKLMLEDGSILHINHILRMIPGKRLVAHAEWQNEQVIAKLFFCKKRAKQHAEREKKGAANLAQMKIPSAELKKVLVSHDKKTESLLFQYLQDADNLQQVLFADHVSFDILLPFLKQVIQELATQHVLGVMQHDLHFKNFMVSTHKVYTLDGAQLTVFPHKLDKETSMKHLALFLSQMGVGFEAMQHQLFTYYVKLRGWLIKKNDVDDLFFMIREANRKRWQHHQKKIFRESSQFAKSAKGAFKGVYDRTRVPKELRDLIALPEQFFHDPCSQMLKNGRSSTVIRITLGQCDWVIKRYNIKSGLHRIKRLFSTSRARKSWYHAQKLVLFNVNVPYPIAFIDSKQMGMNSVSYYICEYVTGTPLSSLHLEKEEPLLIQNVAALLKQVSLVESTHGDLKASNIIIKNNQAYLIDYDGTKEHSTLSNLTQHTQQDWQRFLRNFEAKPAVQRLFAEALLNNNCMRETDEYARGRNVIRFE